MIFPIINILLITITATTISYEIVLFMQLAAWLWYLFFLITFTISYILLKKYASIESITISKNNTLLLIIIALLCVCINIFTLRPDNDDFSFHHRAVLAAADLLNPISIYANALDLPNLPPLSPAHLTTSIETFSALIGKMLGMDTMFFTHNILGSLCLFIFPIILFAFFSKLGFPQKSALFGVILTIILYAVTGDSHADWGNLTLVRSWQGKTIFMTIFVPLTTLLTLLYLNDAKPSPSRLLRLYFVAICSIGLTSTGYFMYPFTIFSIFFIWLLFFNKEKRFYLTTAFALGTTLIFPLVLVLLIKLGLLPNLINTELWEFNTYTGIDPTFWFDEWHILKRSMMYTPTTTIFYLIALRLSFLFFELTKITKLFLSSSFWMFICIVTPPISSFIIKITLPSPYWRLIYTTNMLLIIAFFALYCLTQPIRPNSILVAICKKCHVDNSKILFCLGIIFIITYCALKTPAVKASLLAIPHSYKFVRQTYPITEKCVAILPQNAIGITYEDLLVHLSLRRPDLKFFVTRCPDTLHSFLNVNMREEATLRRDIFWDIYACGANGALKQFLQLHPEIDFLIFPGECTEEQLQERIGLTPNNWEYIFTDTDNKLFLHWKKEGNT